jgi:hypothetical protein
VDGSTYYADVDGDGFGDAGSTTTGCAAVSGFVDDATDCNDGDDTVYPSADELCDDIDNDCNGLVDDGASETWYYDGDGDEFGVDSDTFEGCEPPAGYVAVGGDCDDTEMFISPAEEEACDDIDNDCDGEIDEDEDTLGTTPDCAATDCDEILAIRADVYNGTFFFDDGTDVYADECDFGIPPESVPAWSSDIRPILNMACVSCHDSSAPGGLDLASIPYFRLVNVESSHVPGMDRVEPFAASESYLWHKIMGTHSLVGGFGGVMPPSGGIPPQDIRKITDWINAGAGS